MLPKGDEPKPICSAFPHQLKRTNREKQGWLEKFCGYHQQHEITKMLNCDVKQQELEQRKQSLDYLFNLSVSYKETPQCIAGVHFGAFQRHNDVAILLAVLCRPVLVTLPLEERKQTPSLISTGHMTMNDSTRSGNGFSRPTLPFSTRLVIMIIIPVFCSQTIRQKSSNVDLRGPWAAI